MPLVGSNSDRNCQALPALRHNAALRQHNRKKMGEGNNYIECDEAIRKVHHENKSPFVPAALLSCFRAANRATFNSCAVCEHRSWFYCFAVCSQAR